MRGTGLFRVHLGRKISSAATATAGTGLARASKAVLDASVLVRALAYFQPSALAWLERIALLEIEAAWPTLLYAEVGNALLDLSRGGHLRPDDARLALDAALAISAQATPIEALVEAAWEVASERRLSVYDASYVVLAESLAAPLVTADRRLAEATASSVLITA